MVSQINFTGNVYYLGSTKYYDRNRINEINTIKQYADAEGLDIVVVNKDKYIDNSGYYTTIATKSDTRGERNTLKNITFDFGYGRREIRVDDRIFL